MKKTVRFILCLLIPWFLLGAELQAAMIVAPYPGGGGPCRGGAGSAFGASGAYGVIGAIGAGGATCATGWTLPDPASLPARFRVGQSGGGSHNEASNDPDTGVTLVVLNAPPPGGGPPVRVPQTQQKSANPEPTGLDRGEGRDEVEEEDEEDDEDDEEGFEEEFGKSIDSEISDPFEGYNRIMTSFNDGFYIYVFDPVARGYRYVVPEFGRRGIANFAHNLLFPMRFVNNLLQAKFLNAGEELLRFCINTTLGLLGLWDPAKAWFGLEAHEEDFGQTLGVWGVGAGPHIVLPILGPSNLRDMFSIGPDYYLDPKRFIEPGEKELAVKVLEKVNDGSLHIGEYENLKKDAFDLYPFLRDVYEQNRRKKILE